MTNKEGAKLETCYGAKIHTTKKMREGSREWSIPAFSYYGGRKHGQLQTTVNHYAATPMTLALAEEVTQKLNSSGIEATVCDLFADPDALIHDNLIDIGEEEAPPAPPSTSLVKLAQAIEDCLHQGLSPVEVLNHCNKTVLLL